MVILKPISDRSFPVRRIAHVVRKVPLKEANDTMRDLDYWLAQPAVERIATVTYLMSQFIEKGQRLDKSIIVKRKLKA
jgi:hypothetical protein